jgi:hypothetical protein
LQNEIYKEGENDMADEKRNKNAAPAIPDPYDMTAKQQLNPRADEKNFIELRGGRPILCCGSNKERKKGPGAKCRCYAGQGTDHPGYGRCKFCGGKATGPKSEEGKTAAAANSTVHGLYASVLGSREREIFNQLQDQEVLSLEFEINMIKAKILGYLERKRQEWTTHYKRKLAEKKRKYVCSAPTCKAFVVRGDTEGNPGYCVRCGDRYMVIVDEWGAQHTDEEAQEYADSKSRTYFRTGENGGRSYYHAATIEDNALDRSLNTLGRMVEKHARLRGDNKDDLLGQINAELRAASQGQVSLSWAAGPAQQRKEGGS